MLWLLGSLVSVTTRGPGVPLAPAASHCSLRDSLLQRDRGFVRLRETRSAASVLSAPIDRVQTSGPVCLAARDERNKGEATMSSGTATRGERRLAPEAVARRIKKRVEKLVCTPDNCHCSLPIIGLFCDGCVPVVRDCTRQPDLLDTIDPPSHAPTHPHRPL